MASPAATSPTRHSRHRHRDHDHDRPGSAPSSPTSPRSPPTSPHRSSRESRERTPQSPTRPTSASRQDQNQPRYHNHIRSSSQNYSSPSRSRDRDRDRDRGDRPREHDHNGVVTTRDYYQRHERPTTSRRHTTQVVPPIITKTSHRPLPPTPREKDEEEKKEEGRHENSSRSRSRSRPQRTHSSPVPIQKDGHVLIPVPIRALDAQTPLYVRAPPGQSVDFVFSPVKKKGLLARLLDNIEWEDESPFANKPFRYHQPPTSPVSRPFYKRLLP